MNEITHLEHGSHPSPDEGMCLMEAVAWLAGEPHSDAPSCSSKVIGAFGRAWNDGLSDADRDRLLLPLLTEIVGTGPLTADQEHELALECLDWYLRELTPTFLALVPALEAHAQALRGQPKVDDENATSFAPLNIAAGDAARDAAWAAAGDAARAAAWDAAWAAAGAAAGDAAWAAARDAAGAAAWDAARDAAGAAAGDAAWAAAGDAARAAAGDAAGDAAWAAAGDAARAAAGDAARDAARAAAWDALRPTVEALQQSAAALLLRLCEQAKQMREVTP